MVKTMVVIPSNLKLNELKRRGGYELAESGINQYPIGAYLPLFKQGGKCIGLAKIKSYQCDANKSIVIFDAYKDLEDEQKEAFELLYSLNIGSGIAGNEVDPYGNPDVNLTMSLLQKESPRRRNEPEVKSLSSMMRHGRR